MKIKPLGDNILVEPIEEKEVIKGGIVIPDTAKEKPMEAKVIEVGRGKKDENGKLIPIDEIKKGDTVLTSKYGGTEIKYDDRTYKIVSAGDILAVLS